jgi:hypothetical protein
MMFSFESCNLDVLYGGLGKRKLQFLIKKEDILTLVIKTPDPEPDPYPDPDSLVMLDPDSVNPDPQH